MLTHRIMQVIELDKEKPTHGVRERNLTKHANEACSIILTYLAIKHPILKLLTEYGTEWQDCFLQAISDKTPVLVLCIMLHK